MDNNLIRKVEWINIGLMILCALGARLFPYELLVGSFLILGPAHYLTQISWMRDRNYFVASKQVGPWGWLLPFGFLWLSALGVVSSPIGSIFVFGLLCCLWVGYCWACLDPKSKTSTVVIKTISLLIISFIPTFIIIIFNLPTKFPNWWIFGLPFLLGVLLPTFLHVFAFSAAFMLSGYRKSKEPASMASFALLIGGVITLIFWPMNPQPLPEALRPTLDFFRPLIELLSQTGEIFGPFKFGSATEEYLMAFSSQIASVLAFIYTYHYLNWFSKVEILRWNKMDRPRFVGVVACYAGVLTLMAFSFGTGLVLAIYLANVHMLLEIPLDMRVILGLFSRQDPPGS